MLLRNFMKQDEGVTGMEYAIIGTLIAVAFIAGATAIGAHLSTIFNAIPGNIHT